MDDPEANYAPQSPDLTGYYSTARAPEPALPPQHQHYRGSISHIPPPFGVLPPAEPLASPYAHQLGMAAVQGNPNIPLDNAYYPHQQTPVNMRGGARVKREENFDDEFEPSPEPMQSSAKSSSRKKMKAEALSQPIGDIKLAPGVAEGIEVRTKFPVARIKRIMQADEDVGKVAQVTPVVVSKALELFMISLVTKAATEAKARSSKRVQAIHLKAAIQKDDQFDFLSEIVSKVADAPQAQSKNEDSDEPMETGKKKRAAPRRRKKNDDDF